MKGLAIHISCFMTLFLLITFLFSSMTSLRMMGLGPVHLVRALFHYPLASPLVVSVAPVLKW